MESLSRIVLGILILQIYVHAAPGDVSKLEDIAKVEQAEPKLDAELKEVKTENTSDSTKEAAKTESNSTESQRQKRWYNPYNFGFPPITPPNFPPFGRDNGPNPNFYGNEDPLVQIHRRIQEIASFVRQPPPPPIPHVPIFYPILYIPPEDCRCNQNPSPTTDRPQTSDNNGTEPDIASRWPAMEDTRQNWGFLINETDTDDLDFSRPISFDPIRLDRPVRPPPPVEHGSVQSDSNDQNSIAQPLRPTQNAPPALNKPPSTTPAPFKPESSSENRPQSGRTPPSACDGAVLTCCHQPQVTYDCFAIQGCPQFTSYGNPCEPKQILTVIEKFQNFYGQRGG
ncbi:formin-like protein 14 [Trichoplusia ni]|uniref:Formin-like protein 14 n=1 Tax=Trichoplusia ni TaxID=7111 RepID=A0A7E5WA77_TRINI|nr:formin-like protein 14 [Trichoplusia ni]